MSAEAFVGAVVNLELSSGLKMTGTVFTYDAPNAALVLLQNPSADRPSVKIINTCFIKSVVVAEKDPKDPANKLPRGISADATLPALSGTDSLQKRMNKTLSKAEDRRRYDLAGDATAGLTIAACQLFDRLTLSCGHATFSSNPEHLAIAQNIAGKLGVSEVGEPAVVILVNDVLVTDNGGAGGVSWEAPLVAEKDGTDTSSVVQRVKNAAQAAFKTAA
jgi:hypothetical protein